MILSITFGMIHTCIDMVLMVLMEAILKASHDSPYSGHHTGDKTAVKVLQSGFYWPTLFKDANNYIKKYDACQ